jgi:hypothetical protein
VAEGNTNKYFTDARVRNAISATAPLNFNTTSGVLSMTAASGSSDGYLSSADFTRFNNKQTALTAGVDYATPSGNITGNAANVTGIVSIANGGTGTSTTAGALVALGAETIDNKSNNIQADGSSTTKFPSVKAIKDYVDQQSANAGVADNSLTSAKINGTIAIAKGGTGASTAAGARTNLGLVIGTDVMAANATTVLTGDVTGSGNGSFAATVNSVGGVSSSTIATLPTNVTANTASITANTTSIATINTNLVLKAPLASPAFTGSPTAPTPTTNDNSTKVATTEYVQANLGTVSAGTLTGTTLASTITGSSLTSVGTLSNLTVTNPIAGSITGNAATATALATGRTIGITGDLTYTSPSFTGSGNITAAAVLANSGVISGTYGSSTAIPSLTIDSKGRITSASTTSIIAGVNTVTSIAGISNAAGATISGTTITLTPADGINGGIITNGSQTIAGAKTFTGAGIFSSTLSAGATTLASASITGNESIGGSLAVTGATTLSNLNVSGGIKGVTPSWKINDTGSASWFLLGTWNTSQNGNTLYMRVVAHSGYNADANQNQVTELMFFTSNGNSYWVGTGGNIYGNGSASVNSRLGTGSNAGFSYSAPNYFRVKQVSNTQYEVYAYFGQFMGNSNYSVQITPGDTWVDGGGNTVSTPSGTYLDIIPSSSGGAMVDNNKTSSFTLSATDNGRVFLITSSSTVTVTVPNTLPAGFNCQFIQGGTGAVTMASSGFVLNSANGFTTRSRNSVIGVVMFTSTSGYIVGDSTF